MDFRIVQPLKLIKPAILVLAILILSTSAFSQVEQPNINHNEQVTIIGTYDPSINEAFKIGSRPGTPALSFTKSNFRYEPLETRQPAAIKLQAIEPATIRADKRTKSYQNTLRAGIGSWMTPYFDFNHGSSKKNDRQLNVRIYHLSSFKNIPDYSPSPFSNSLAEIHYDKFSKNHIFSIGAGYRLNTNRYYGFKPDDYNDLSIDEGNLKQMFNLVKANFGLKSNFKKDDKLHHIFGISGYYYFDKYNSSETNARFAFDLYKAFRVTKHLNFQNLGIDGRFEYFGNKDTIRNTSDILVEAEPYFKARYNIIGFKVGLKFAYLMADQNTFAFNPILDIFVNVLPESLTIYAGLDGGLEKNSFLKLTTINPWFSGMYDLYLIDSTYKWQNNRFRVYAGLRGNIAKQLGFNIEAGWLLFKDMAYYVNTTDSKIWPVTGPFNKFTVVYDDGNLFTVSGELMYTLGDVAKIWLNGEYNIYTLDSLSQAYHKPISKFGIGGSYLINKKVNIRLEVLGYGDRYAVEREMLGSKDIILEGFFDINLGLEYYIGENFSVFLTGTNLLNNNYQRFYNYPVQGLQIMAGIGLRF